MVFHQLEQDPADLVKAVYDRVVARDPDQTEYHQAWTPPFRCAYADRCPLLPGIALDHVCLNACGMLSAEINCVSARLCGRCSSRWSLSSLPTLNTLTTTFSSAWFRPLSASCSEFALRRRTFILLLHICSMMFVADGACAAARLSQSAQ
eukprot:3515969-Rhodomonas_salina.1